jgi:xylulokinase
VKDPIQANVRGAAFLAGVALGHIRFSDIPELIKIERTFQPNPENRKIYNTLFKAFLGIYKANRKIYARLNRN